MTGSQRRKYFPEDYMRRFNNIHNNEVGGDVHKGGYPDMGNGRYSVDLKYNEWFVFNNWQRAHYNYLEQLTPVLIWIFISMFYAPLAAGILGFVYFIGRILYTWGYVGSPNKRIFGAIILDLSFLGLFILSITSIVKWG
jgi:hypothetical protein